jgi:hypothetical protein
MIALMNLIYMVMIIMFAIVAAIESMIMIGMRLKERYCAIIVTVPKPSSAKNVIQYALTTKGIMNAADIYVMTAMVDIKGDLRNGKRKYC